MVLLPFKGSTGPWAVQKGPDPQIRIPGVEMVRSTGPSPRGFRAGGRMLYT